jgi:transaldolase
MTVANGGHAKTALEQLREYTIVVADTGDVEAIERLQPVDATTNPSLIFKAATMPQYDHLILDAMEYGKGNLTTVMVGSTMEVMLENGDNRLTHFLLMTGQVGSEFRCRNYQDCAGIRQYGSRCSIIL